MKAHLIKSSELHPETFTQVVAMLQAAPGPITFAHDADAVIDFNDEELVTKTIRNRKEFETTAEQFFIAACAITGRSFLTSIRTYQTWVRGMK